MTRSKRKNEYEAIKDKYLLLYKRLKHIYSPALNADVLLTRWGWNHISNKKFRTQKERIQRIMLISHVTKIITTTYNYSTQRKVKEYDMFELRKKIEGEYISVIIAKKGKKYYFLSIMKE